MRGGNLSAVEENWGKGPRPAGPLSAPLTLNTQAQAPSQSWRSNTQQQLAIATHTGSVFGIQGLCALPVRKIFNVATLHLCKHASLPR